jgi:hypothetical protein
MKVIVQLDDWISIEGRRIETIFRQKKYIKESKI